MFNKQLGFFSMMTKDYISWHQGSNFLMLQNQFYKGESTKPKTQLNQLKGQSHENQCGLQMLIFREDNNATSYLGVELMPSELLQPKVGTIWCIYTIQLCTLYIAQGPLTSPQDDVTISFTIMTSRANLKTF